MANGLYLTVTLVCNSNAQNPPKEDLEQNVVVFFFKHSLLYPCLYMCAQMHVFNVSFIYLFIPFCHGLSQPGLRCRI